MKKATKQNIPEKSTTKITNFSERKIDPDLPPIDFKNLEEYKKIPPLPPIGYDYYGDLSLTQGKIAFGYIRVSTTMQSDDGISLVTQKNKITEHCNYKKLSLVHIYEDAGISGAGTKDRAGLKELLKIIKKGNYLIVADLSRLSRNCSDAINIFSELKEKGAFLVSLNPDIDFSTSIGEMMFGVLMAIYQLERDQISERVTANLKTLSEQGKLRGRPKYGYRFVSKDLPFEEVPEQQEVIKIIVELCTENYSMRQIANILNRDGHNKTLRNGKNGQLFYAETVKSILANHGYTISSKLKNEIVEVTGKNNTNEENI